jgi:DNA-binding protein H-NS
MEGQSQLFEEIEQIEQQLAQKRQELLEKQQAGEIEKMPDDKEMLHKIIGEKIHSGAQSPQSTQTQTDDDAKFPSFPTDVPSYLYPNLQGKVQSLVNTAFIDSIQTAVQNARDLNNPALMDAFHDALVDQLYEQLIERGKLKKVE